MHVSQVTIPSGSTSNLRVVGRATSIGRVLLALPLLATSGVGARRPVGVELHVQLPLPARQLIVLGLLLAAQRVPLNRTIESASSHGGHGRHQEKPRARTERPASRPPTHSALARMHVRRSGAGRRGSAKGPRRPARLLGCACTSRLDWCAFFLSLLLLGAVAVIVPRAPARVQLHVQLALLARLLVILGLLLATQRVPLRNHTIKNTSHTVVLYEGAPQKAPGNPIFQFSQWLKTTFAPTHSGINSTNYQTRASSKGVVVQGALVERRSPLAP
jgi:hypothetical protein